MWLNYHQWISSGDKHLPLFSENIKIYCSATRLLSVDDKDSHH